jgi:hypothetical protein
MTLLAVLCLMICAMFASAQAPPTKPAEDGTVSLYTQPKLSGDLYAVSNTSSTYFGYTNQIQPVAPAPGTLWSAAYYFDARSKTSASVVAYKVKTITGVFGKNFSLDLSTFAGYNLNNSNYVAGWEVGKSFTIANGVWLTAGLAVSVEANHPIGAGGVLGLSIQF